MTSLGQNPVGHDITLILCRAQTSSKALLLKWITCTLIPVVHPLIPPEVAEVGYVSLGPKSHSVWIRSMQLEQLLGCHIIYQSTAFHAIIPEHDRRARITKILACAFLDQPHSKLSTIGPLSLSFQCLERRANLREERLHIALILGLGPITNKNVRRTNLLGKQLKCKRILRLLLHRIDGHVVHIGEENLAACVAS